MCAVTGAAVAANHSQGLKKYPPMPASGGGIALARPKVLMGAHINSRHQGGGTAKGSIDLETIPGGGGDIDPDLV